MKTTFQKVNKFVHHYDAQCSDAWITDILNGEIDINKLINTINKFDESKPRQFLDVYKKGE